MIEARRPDIVVLHKKEKKCLIVDVAVPGDCRINEKEKEKIDKYQDLRREVSRLWQQKKVHVVPIVIGVLGSISKNFICFLHQLEIDTNMGVAKGGITRYRKNLEESFEAVGRLSKTLDIS